MLTARYMLYFVGTYNLEMLLVYDSSSQYSARYDLDTEDNDYRIPDNLTVSAYDINYSYYTVSSVM